MMREHQQDYPSLTVACQEIGQQLDLGRETLRNWVRQAEIDAGNRDGVTTAETEEIKRLKAENNRLREPTRSCARPRFSSRQCHRRKCRRGWLVYSLPSILVGLSAMCRPAGPAWRGPGVA